MVTNLADLSSIDILKTYGNFRYVKGLISKEFGFSIKANSWESLYEQLYKIKSSIIENKKQLYVLVNDESSIKALGNFDAVKMELSKILGIKLSTRSWSELFNRFKSVVFTFLPNEILNDKRPFYTYEEKVKKFEEIKFQNFVNSSKLEGIEVTKSSLSMDELVKKYTEIGKNSHG